MELIVFGLNHRTAPLEVREGWAFSPEESRRALAGLQAQVELSEHVILSTCNRTEFYGHFPKTFAPSAPGAEGGRPRPKAGPEPPASEAQRHAAAKVPSPVLFYHRFYHQATGIVERGTLGEADPAYFYVHRGDEAVEHLFRLASGLDSMILGESQILKQIKDAFTLAQDAKTAGKFFHRLFPAALKAAKRVRTMTPLAEGCITPGQAALQLSRDALGELQGRSLLLIGSGKIATYAAIAFRDEELASYRVVNRTPERAAELVEKIGRGDVEDWSRLPACLSAADIVVSSTGALLPIVTRAFLEPIQEARQGRPLVIIDLAVPRDFTPDVAEIPGVRLLNIDDLNGAIQENVDRRHKYVPLAEEIIREELSTFLRWMTYLEIDPVLKHLVDRFEQIRLGELQHYISQFPPEHHPLVKEMTSSLVKKLLHFPIEKLKSLRDGKGLSDAEVAFLRRLFLSGL
jgi:glutamyl-tRNA reductase